MKRKGLVKGTILNAVLIAFMIAAAFFCTDTYAQNGKPDQPSDVLNQDSKKPSGFTNLEKKDPYGSIGNIPFLLSEQNELFGYWGHHKDVKGRYYDNLDMTIQKHDGSYAVIKSVNKKASGDTAANMDDIGYGDNAYRFVKGTSFDPTGSGRRDYAAYLGWNPVNNKYICFVRKPAASKVYTCELDTAEWVSSAKPYYFEMISKMAITSGDYDGDGKDSLIVYCCGDGSNVFLYEIGFDGSSFSKTKVLDLSTVLVDDGYKKQNGVKYKPIVTLATGDFDGDEIDELAYSAGFHNDSGSAADGWIEDFSSIKKYTTCIGIGDRGKSWNMSSPIWLYVKGDSTHYNDYEMIPYTLMHGGTIAAGNLDGKGADELIAVGYTSNGAFVYNYKNSTDQISRACDVDKNHYVTSIIRYSEGSYVSSGLSSLDMSTFGKHSMDNIKDSRYVWMPITLACGRTNGHSSPADVFISGRIYSFNTGSAKEVFTPKIMTQTFNTFMDDPNGTYTYTDVYWVNDVTVGNFNHNDAGREQFVYTLWFKEKGERNSSVSLGIMGGAKFKDNTDENGNITFGPCTEYAASDIRGDINGWIDQEKTEAASKVISKHDDWYCNTVFVATDVNDDGVLARRSKSNSNKKYTGYVYTDPEVLAVLQAGPYFKEIDDIGGYADPCGTEFGIETSCGYASSSGNSVSFGVGFAGEVSAAAVKASIEAGYTMDWSQSFEDAYEVSHSLTFTAQEEDQVILSRIPEAVYCYDIYKKGDWVQNGHTVRVPMTPVYYQLNIDDYNSFVDEYNAIAKKAGSKNTLVKITDKDLPADNEGNPYKYRSVEWSDSEPQLSAGEIELSHSGGFAQGAWSSSASSTVSTEIAHGFSFSLTVQGGGSLGAAEGWAGGYVNLDYSNSTGESTSKGKTTAAAGQVQNISTMAIGNQLTPAQIKAYKFNWSFGTWSRTLQNGKAKIPFYGYRVSSLQAPAPRVEDLSIDLVTDTDNDPALELTWTNPASAERPVAEYVLYTYDLDDDSEAILTIPAGQTSCQLKAETYYRNKFTISAKTAAGQSLEGIPSEKIGLKPSQKTQAEAAIAKMNEDKAAAENVRMLIDAIPGTDSLTAADEAKVTAAKEAYEALTDDQKARLDKLDVNAAAKLTAAVEKMAQIAAAAAQELAQQAQTVADMINALPSNNAMTLTDAAAVAAARASFDALPEAAKTLIPDKLDALTTAEAKIAELKINAIPEENVMTLNDENTVTAAREAYNALTDAAKAKVPSSSLVKLTAAENKITELKKSGGNTEVNNPAGDSNENKPGEGGNETQPGKNDDKPSGSGSESKPGTNDSKPSDSGSETKPGTNDGKPSGGNSKEESGQEGSKSDHGNQAAPVKAESIQLDGISHKIAAGKKIKLEAQVFPENADNKGLVWTSSNEKAASVSQAGVVTVKKLKKKAKGKTVVITAEAADGSGVKASWKIKVMKGVVKKVKIKKAKKKLKAGKKMKLKGKVKASKGANKKLKWISSNPEYATVSSRGVVKALPAGKGRKVRITAMATDGSNKKKTIKFKIR